MKDYIQSDPRWANHPYAGETMAVAGCGPTSCADVIATITGEAPPIVADYITSIGGASNGQGTYWGTIAPACAHYGHEARQLNSADLYGIYDSAAEREWLAEMKTGKYYGILLMGQGYFCNNGHFIAISEVREDNAAYAFDVAWSARSGWHSWDVYQGDVKVFYLVKKNILSEGDTLLTFPQIAPGSYGSIQHILQCILRSRLYKGKNGLLLAMDGHYGLDTEYAVKCYQKDEGLLEDGICGPDTWGRLLTLDRQGNQYILHQIQKGDSNTSVLYWQEYFVAKGYLMAINWKFDDAMLAAAKRYQQEKGLVVDGILGPNSAKKMYW